jgi:hypothetical protein
METWPEFYVLHVLRVSDEREEPLYSRIWVDRRNMMVMAHQLFDGDGSIIAEASMKSYRAVELRPEKKWIRRLKPDPNEKPQPDKQIMIPDEITIYWPKDKLAFVLRVRTVTLNGETDARLFEAPKRTQPGVDIQEISGPPMRDASNPLFSPPPSPVR